MESFSDRFDLATRASLVEGACPGPAEGKILECAAAGTSIASAADEVLGAGAGCITHALEEEDE